MSKEDKNGLEEVYKREIKFNSNGTVSIDKKVYVEVSKEFSAAIVKGIKTGGFYEDILTVNGVDYMQKERYDAYKAVAKYL